MSTERSYKQVKEESALEIIKKSIVIDALTYAPSLTDTSYVDKLLAINITTGIHVTLVEPYCDASQALSGISRWHKTIRESKKLLLVNTVKDIEEAKKTKKIAIIGGFQNTTPIEHDLKLLEAFYKLGIRIVQLSYYEQNYAGSGCYEMARMDSGLTYFGEKVVEECNRLGILVDLSHCSDKTAKDAIEYSKEPVAFTHIAAKALTNHFRNKPDDLIKALAEKGGVIGVLCWSPVCEIKKGVRPGVDDFIAHLQHIVKIAGIDHVGLGLDLTPGWLKSEFNIFKSKYPELVGYYTFENRSASGIEDHMGIINITRGLMAYGYSESEIKKVLGENWLKLLRTIWKLKACAS